MKRFLISLAVIAVVVGLRYGVNWLFADKCDDCGSRLMSKKYTANGGTYCENCKPAGYYVPSK